MRWALLRPALCVIAVGALHPNRMTNSHHLIRMTLDVRVRGLICLAPMSEVILLSLTASLNPTLVAATTVMLLLDTRRG